jgi:hypothetical protein
MQVSRNAVVVPARLTLTVGRAPGLSNCQLPTKVEWIAEESPIAEADGEPFVAVWDIDATSPGVPASGSRTLMLQAVATFATTGTLSDRQVLNSIPVRIQVLADTANTTVNEVQP